MTPQRMRDAAQILGELGNGKMANELELLAKQTEKSQRLLKALEEEPMKQEPEQLPVSAEELRRIARAERVTLGDADKVKAFNLLLTSRNINLRRVAERYLEGVRDYDAFVEFLRKLPKPVRLQGDEAGASER